ncbi:MAG: leucine-rich repeat domain-containing protein, partial [Oscillospiraceae bacterium]|nr:leucine-rich repeat domain-containing protein [Oscillospiraceae bacterium]
MKTSVFKRIAAAVTAAVLTASALPLDTAAEYVSYTLEQTEDITEVNGAVTSGDYSYNLLRDGTIEITDYTGSAPELVIPSEMDGYTVTSIGDDAFRNCDNLTVVTLPESITYIGGNAFSYCDNLISITIPDGVTVIGNHAFDECIRLKSISLPNGIKTIGVYTFSGCDSLTSVTIPDSVTLIWKYAFEYCEGLTNITLPNSIKTIGTGAFYNCSNLTSITIQDSVSTIEDYAFYNCNVLFDVYYTGTEAEWLNIDITSDGNEVLEAASIHYNDNLAEFKYEVLSDGTIQIIDYTGSAVILEIPSEIEGYRVTAIRNSAFYNCDNTTDIIVSDGVTTIDDYAFVDCDNLKCITISDSVTEIGEGAFWDCSSLTAVYYTGTKEEWAKINIDSGNTYLTSATIHYNYVDGGTSTDDNTADEQNDISTGLEIKEEDRPDHQLAKAEYTCGNVKKDLLKEHYKITFGDTSLVDLTKEFTITCTTKGDADKISIYALYCGSKCIGSSNNGVFTMKGSQLAAGKDYYISVFAKDGVYTKTPLMLEVGESAFSKPSEITLGGSDGFELAINNEILGNMTLACDVLKLPVQLVVTPDNKVRLGLNLKKDALEKDSSFLDFKKKFEKAKKTIKSGLTSDPDFTEVKKWLDTPGKKGNLISKDKSCNITAAGYGEAAIGENGLTSISFVVIGSVEYSNGITKTFMAGPVPITVSIDLTAGATINAQLGYNFEKQEAFGDADLGLKVAIEPFVGVGLGNFIGVGVTGKGELSVDIVLVSTSEPSGVEAVDLTAGLGIKAYLGPFEYKHTIAEKTWNLYSRGSTTSLAQTGELTVAPLYDSSSYKELSLREYKSEVVGTTAAANAEPAALIEDAYLAASPKLAAVGDDIVMLYLDSDMERGTADQTVLKYMVYSGGAWSEPKQLDSNDT